MSVFDGYGGWVPSYQQGVYSNTSNLTLSSTYAYPATYEIVLGDPTQAAPPEPEDELGWLRRRVDEITDLFPVAA